VDEFARSIRQELDYRLEGRNAEARTAFEAAIAREPRSWVAWYDLARASTGTARQNALTHARRLDPHEPQLTALQ
jgi:hypothetical protein